MAEGYLQFKGTSLMRSSVSNAGAGIAPDDHGNKLNQFNDQVSVMDNQSQYQLNDRNLAYISDNIKVNFSET